MSDELDGLTRAQLLERCKAAGLKASGWAKPEMLARLRMLAGSSESIAQGDTNEAPEDENPPIGPTSRSGWCGPLTPLWSIQHQGCRGNCTCPCPCHEPGFERPPIPAGARLSKFNTTDKKDNDQ